MNLKYFGIAVLTAMLSHGFAFSQEKTPSDSTAVAKEGDRNVMLNANSANAGPRNVNIGLPASVGGTTVLENGLPVVYFFWPEMPFNAWRTDAMTNGMKLMDLGSTAVHVGDVGFSVGSYDNLGTDSFQGNGGLKSNSFGLINSDIAISNSLGNGWKYAAGAYANYDPGTFKLQNSDKFFSDQTVILKAALTKEYAIGSRGKGSVSLLYKFVDSKSISSSWSAPYTYGKNGKVEELDGFTIGNDSYFTGQRIWLKDAFTGKYVERDLLRDYGSTSHTVDLIGKNKFDNGLNFDYIIRAHSGKSGQFLPAMTGIQAANPGEYVYADTGEPYLGKNVQGVMALASRKTPVKSLTSLFELSKKSGLHEWKIGLNQWNYGIDRFATEGARYYQEVAASPRKLISTSSGNTNAHGNIEAGNEYHNGHENKTAIFATDKWDVSNIVTLSGGVRLEYQSLRGDYIDNRTPREEIYINTPKSKIKKDFFNKTVILNGVFKLTRSFGLLAEATYNEQSGHLENYSAGNYPDLKQSNLPGGTIGLYYNHPLISLVSKATYIQRDEYRTTLNLTHPEDLSLVIRAPGRYDIQTLGWTTDIVTSPFKNFNLHFLFTYQNPVYKNYSGTADFGSGKKVDYDFSGKNVTKISKVLIEIDPSYTWDDLKVWFSARYFSKQYANLPNTLYFAGRWETFAGVNYSFNKHLDGSITVVNLLNERGAQGTISGTDLVNEATAKEKIGTVMSGSYIRPFTVEFGLKYKF
ncbi:MAG: hypothetical protein LBO74_08395 [Candidatus Symbiothrix sp.]|jgi:hypothetical protein|nr:hypothetical protein [Candidatus Symbiothrix sp.]